MIAQVKSEIDKNKDALGNLVNNQEFLLLLSPPDFLKTRTQNMQQKHEALKRQWIAEHKADPRLDFDIIFKDDEDIHEGVKMEFSFLNQPGQKDMNATMQGTKKSKNDYSDHGKMTDEDWEHRFE